MLKEKFLTLHDAEDYMRVTTNVRYEMEGKRTAVNFNVT